MKINLNINMNTFYRTVLCSLIVLLSACATSPKTNFYLLSSEHPNEVALNNKISIGLWEVDLPEIIDRPEIVTRTGAHTIDLADFHRWAGGLSSNMSLLIASELSHNLRTSHIDISPWTSHQKFNYQVKIHVWEFGGALGDESNIRGVFVILNGNGDKKIIEKIFSFKEKVNGKSYSEMAAAMSRLVVSLSKEISQTIDTMHKE